MSDRQIGNMAALDLVKLSRVMNLSSGSAELAIGLVDGPVLTDHPDLDTSGLCAVSIGSRYACREPIGQACRHGTFVAGILKARRGSPAPAICPTCPLLVRPIFLEAHANSLPTANMDEVATAIVECVEAGARVINVSAGAPVPTMRAEPELDNALNYAAKKGVPVVAAGGNQGTLGTSALTRHPGVIPVVAFRAPAQPTAYANLSASFGKRGIGAPGVQVTSLGVDGSSLALAGTSAATPFVTGAIALLWSLFPSAVTADVTRVLRASAPHWRRSVAPPLLDATAACRLLSQIMASQ